MGWPRLLAEAAGAFGLTLIAAGGDVAGALSGGEVSPMARAIAPGLFVMAYIYAIGDVSGLHINPAVTLGFTLKRLFPWPWLLPYWIAQLAGAVLAGLVLVLVFGSGVTAEGVSRPHAVGPLVAVAIEAFLTWVLVTVILGTTDRARSVGPNAALAVGGTIILCGLIALPIEGASMNPARSTGPAVSVGQLGDVWIYWVGPLVGSALAVAFTSVMHGAHPKDREEVEAAQGKRGAE
jgi:aquaporin Z